MRNRIRMKYIYITLTVVSIGMLVGALFVKCDILQNILISFSINIITSLLIIFCIDVNVEKHTRAMQLKNERALARGVILRQHKTVELILSIYTLAFNQLVTPWEKRTKNGEFLPINSRELNANISIPDMKDIFSTDVTVYGKMGNTVLETYEVVYDKTINAFERMLTSCEFQYYISIEDAISEVIKISYEANSIETLISYKNNDTIKKLLIEMMGKYEGNPITDCTTNKYSGNLFLGPLLLYLHLYRMRSAIEKYKKEIMKLSEEETHEI